MRQVNSSRSRSKTRLITLLDLLAACIPVLLVVYNFDALVRNPIDVLVLHLPISLFFKLLPRLFDTGVTDLASCLAQLLIFFVPGFYMLAVLMGAPFTTHFYQTVLLATHIAILASFGPLLRFGLVRRSWLPLLLSSQETSEAQLQKLSFGSTGLEGAFWGTLIGAYLGAIPIPLDWDRDWQVWPVTVHVGACLGHALGASTQLVWSMLFASPLGSTKSKKSIKKT